MKSGRHDIVSCYSRNEVSRNAFARKYHSKAYCDPLDAIKDKDVDAVYVVTPHNVHFKFAKMALREGRPVFLEKPFTVSADETTQLIELARQKDVFLAEAMWTWYHGASLQVRKWIEDGMLRDIKKVRFTYHLNSVHYAKRVADPKRAGGALLDITVYPIAYAYSLFGLPDEIEASARIENGIDLTDEIIFIYSDGKRVEISTSIMDYHGLERLRIDSSDGFIKVSSYHHANRASLVRSGKKFVYHPKEPRHISYVYEFDEVEESIRKGLKESSSYPLSTTMEVMGLIERIKGQIGLKYTQLEK
jgi:predicted dehydrogenase